MLTELGKLFHPLYHALAYLLVFWYGLVPNYAVAIALFTVTVMVVLAPLTVKSTRSMLAMQRLQPEMNKLKEKYKNDKLAMQTEMSQLFKANGVSPAGGCVPMLLPLPVFIVLYKMIEGLTKVLHGKVDPQYISHGSLLYKHLIAAHGAMTSFGMNLAKAATSSHGSFLAALPFYGLLVVCIGLQFVQMRQLSSRAPKQTGSAAQTQAIMKFMPLIFGFIYLAIPAGVNVYFLVSSLFRIGQQELMYRFDPQVRVHAEAIAETNKQSERGVVVRGAAKLSSEEPAPVGFLASLRAARAELVPNAATDGAGARNGSTRSAGARPASRPSPRASTAPVAEKRTSRPTAPTTKVTGRSNGAAQRPPAGKPAQSKRPQPVPTPNGATARTTAPANAAPAKAGSGKQGTPAGKPAQSKRPQALPTPNGAKPNGAGVRSAAAKQNGPTPNDRISPPKANPPPPDGKAPTPPKQAPRSGKSPTRARAASPDQSGDQQNQSWARRPREAVAVPASTGRSRPQATTRTVDGPEKSKGVVESSPNRSRDKRARRAR